MKIILSVIVVMLMIGVPAAECSGHTFQTSSMMNICNKISTFLVQSCDTLNSDDTLTQDGMHARSCIENGALLAGGVFYLEPRLQKLYHCCRWRQNLEDVMMRSR